MKGTFLAGLSISLDGHALAIPRHTTTNMSEFMDEKDGDEVTILFLGDADCGKSTFLS